MAFGPPKRQSASLLKVAHIIFAPWLPDSGNLSVSQGVHQAIGICQKNSVVIEVQWLEWHGGGIIE
jgi:hypothetical protein